jgi:hypothetical protein
MIGVHRTRAVLVLLGVAAGTVGEAGPVRAAGTEEDAQQAFREGVEAARQSHWPEARASFEQAYALSPRPVVLINLAGAQARTGRLIEAARNYHRILEDPASSETAPFRKAAAEVLPELEQRIPRIRVHATGNTEADTFQVDGMDVPAASLAGPLPLDPGQHTLVVSRAGVERARVLFSLAEREERDIPLGLPAVVALPSAQGLPQPPATSDSGLTLGATPVAEAPARRERPWWASPWTWGTIGAVVVVAATSAILLYSYEHRERPFVGNIMPGSITVGALPLGADIAR